VKGTRLWKPAGSPLIQGRSRRERPFAFDWLVGALLGFLVGFAGVVGVMVYTGTDLETSLVTVWLPALLSAVAVAALGVSAGRRFGWHPRWIAAALMATLVVLAGCLALVMFAGSRLGG